MLEGAHSGRSTAIKSALSQPSQPRCVECGREQPAGEPLAGTHGSASWLAESGSYAASDETVTQAAMGAYKAATRLIASEELLADEAVGLDDYLVGELGARLGVLQENAFILGDGSGRPLGITDASAGFTTVTAATGRRVTGAAEDHPPSVNPCAGLRAGRLAASRPALTTPRAYGPRQVSSNLSTLTVPVEMSSTNTLRALKP